MTKLHYGFWLLILLLTACQSHPRPIEYGSDMCVFCKMSIVDKQHAARAISDKGKVFTFDAIECMVPFILIQENKHWRSLEINDYDKPGELIPAEGSYYLISQNIPSPMGAFLSGFSNEDRALEMQKAHGGTLYSWENLATVLSTH